MEQISKQQQMQSKSIIQRDGFTMCAICLSVINWKDRIWVCPQCVKQAHLDCMRQWIQKQKSIAGGGIINYCPMCKYQQELEVPIYYCYCRQVRNPKEDKKNPHTCGKVCNKMMSCGHPCPEICHPGKCTSASCRKPELQTCKCGTVFMNIECRMRKQAFCSTVCKKLLPCGEHICGKSCKDHPCGECREQLVEFCLCGKNASIKFCGTKTPKFKCKQTCNTLLSCGIHTCQDGCHQKGLCKDCPMRIDADFFCVCGSTILPKELNSARKTCLDPITIIKCNTICGKRYINCQHYCTEKCQVGDCPPCNQPISLFCRCGSTEKVIPCHQRGDYPDEFRCNQRGLHTMDCDRHLCQTVCCPKERTRHRCHEPCGKELACGKHICHLQCHPGIACEPCDIVELKHCPCGIKCQGMMACQDVAPGCAKPCSKKMRCGHMCQQTCHSGDCLCKALVTTQCRCQRETIVIECGRMALCKNLCGKQLECGHKCLARCQEGNCPTLCNQVCGKPNKVCGHPCSVLCHTKSCEEGVCNANIELKCSCGNIKKIAKCGDNTKIECSRVCQTLIQFKKVNENHPLYFAPELMELFQKKPEKVKYLQDKLNGFLLTGKPELVIASPLPELYREDLRMLLFSHYKLNSCFVVSRQNGFDMHISLLPASQIPQPSLSKWMSSNPKHTLSLPYSSAIYISDFAMVPIKQFIDQVCVLCPKDLPYLHAKSGAIFFYFWEVAECQTVYRELKSKFRRAKIGIIIMQRQSEQESQEQLLQFNHNQAEEIISQALQNQSYETIVNYLAQMEDTEIPIFYQQVIIRSLIILEEPNNIISQLLFKLLKSYEKTNFRASKFIIGRTEPLRALQGILEESGISVSENQPQFAVYAILNSKINQIHFEESIEESENVQQIINLMISLSKTNLEQYFELLGDFQYLTSCLVRRLYPQVIERVLTDLQKKKALKQQFLLGMLQVRSIAQAKELLTVNGYNLAASGNKFSIEKSGIKSGDFRLHIDKINETINEKRKQQEEKFEQDYPIIPVAFGDGLENKGFLRNLLRKMRSGD